MLVAFLRFFRRSGLADLVEDLDAYRIKADGYLIEQWSSIDLDQARTRAEFWARRMPQRNVVLCWPEGDPF
jgi:hypothetical protein